MSLPRDSPAAATTNTRRTENMELRSHGRLFGGINLAPLRARRLFQQQHNLPAGRLRPLGADFLVFSLGFASVICLIFITGNLLRTRPMSPVTIAVFVLALSYCCVLVRRQRMASLDRGGAAGGRSEGGDRGGQQDGVTLDKETRHQLMEYFIFRPSEEKNGPLARDLASAERGGGGVGGNPSASSPQIPSPSEAPGASLASLPFAWIERRREKEQSQGEGGGGGGQEEGKNVKPPASTLYPHKDGMKLSHPQSSAPPGTGSIPSREHSPFCRRGHMALPRGTSCQQTGNGACGHPTPPFARPGAFACALNQRGNQIRGMGRSERERAGNGGGDERTDASSARGIISAANGCSGPSCAGANSKAPAEGHSGEWSTAGACIVCFGDYSYGEELCRLPCRHLYHATCIDAWLDGANHAWCPLCKTGVVEGFEISQRTSARGDDAGLNAV
ncbi:unnamed protein product [Ascophyllum nodosum]